MHAVLMGIFSALCVITAIQWLIGSINLGRSKLA
jgi:hypothetical protein